MDYAAPIRSLNLLMVLVTKLNISQKIGKQAIIKAFYIVVFIIVESKLRLKLPSIYNSRV